MTNINSIDSSGQNSNSNVGFLKRALYANAIFSGISGLDFIIFSNRITNFLGWSQGWIIPAIGAGLILFAVFIVMVARAPRPNGRLVQTIIASDIAWIILSYIVIFLPATNILATGTSGKMAIAILADIVLILAVFQFIGLRRLKAI